MLLLERLYVTNRNHAEPWRQIKTADGWSYWRELRSGRRHLFDLRRDPHQVHDLARQKPEKARRLDRRMQRMRDCADPCP